MTNLTQEKFVFIMIKTTRYDEDGYPIIWMRSFIPSNSLTVLNGLAKDCRERQVLGPHTDIQFETYDESNIRIRPDKIIASIKQSGARALIGLVGVQSNQFDRAVDIGRQFTDAGLAVIIGGFHVSGCLAMLPELPDEIKDAQKAGISMFAGEAETGRLDEVFRDAYDGCLKPLYNHMNDLPDLVGQPTPILWREALERNIDMTTSFDLGRGCPYQCSFCTIINVQGRKSRFRSPDDVEAIIRENAHQGVGLFFITDDNFARNKCWEALLDRLIWLREKEGFEFSLIIQVDTLCHKTPGFIKKCARAGTKRVFIGLENINPDNLASANKRQNRITEYREMLLEWRKNNVITYAGYIIGFPNDTRQSIRRDIEIIKNELPLEFLSFFFLTPLPGSQDHKQMLDDGVWMDQDLNKYNLYNRVTHHAKMSDEEWDEAYREAWQEFYSLDHVETQFRRAFAHSERRAKHILKYTLQFKVVNDIEKVHPLEGGVIRRQYRADRRSGFARESALAFYPRQIFWLTVKIYKFARLFWQIRKIYRKVERDPDRKTYSDTALSAPNADEFVSMEIYTQTSGASGAVEKKLRDDARREKFIQS